MPEHTLFRNYDIRGEFGKELTADAAYIIARAYAQFSGAKHVALGADARISSPEIKEKVKKGLMDSGVNVDDIGMSSTDVLYFATWHGTYDGGIMITASHMPGKYNGMKFLRLGVGGMLEPIGRGLGMEELEEIANAIEARREEKDSVISQGTYKEVDIWDEYVKFVRGFVDVHAIKDLNVVMDAGNGMGGMVAKKVFKGLNIDSTELFFEPDGTFPNHEPNPFVPENRIDIEAKVKEVGADLGIAWDADCDRCYFINEKGEYIHSDFIIVLLARHFLAQVPGANIVYDVRASRAVPDWIEKLGGVGHMERVGHTYIKPRMRKTNAVFGGETSGHFYFAQNAFMDSGFIPALIIMELIATSGKKLSELVAELGDYYISGEINFTVSDIPAVMANIKQTYADADIDEMDGLSVSYADWHFNTRPSANDPVLRLNLEANSDALLQEKLAEVTALITGA